MWVICHVGKWTEIMVLGVLLDESVVRKAVFKMFPL